MTQLLEQAFEQLRALPEDLQDKIAHQLIKYVGEIELPDNFVIDD